MDIKETFLFKNKITVDYIRNYLSDGLYVIDRGDGWVRGLEIDIVGKVPATSGPSEIGIAKEVEDTTKFIGELKASVGFNIGIVNASFEAAYESTSAEKKTIHSKFNYKINEGYIAYGILYKYYYRDDIIKVKDNKIIYKVERYRFSGLVPIFDEYPEYDDDSFRNLKFTTTRCLLGKKENMVQILDLTEEQKLIGVLSEENSLYTFNRRKNTTNPMNIIFKVPESGVYKIQSEYGEIFSIYEKKFENKGILTFVDEVKTKGAKKSFIYLDLDENKSYNIRIVPRLGIPPQIRFNKVDTIEGFLKDVPIYELNNLNPNTVKELNFYDKKSNYIALIFTVNGDTSNYISLMSKNTIFDADLYPKAREMKG